MTHIGASQWQGASHLSEREITSVVPCDSIFWDEGEHAKYQGTFGEEIHISAEGGFLWCAYGWERRGDL